MATISRPKRFFGRLLVELREAAGLQAKDVAKNIGVDASTMTRYESGENRITTRLVLDHLLELYKASPADRDLAYGLWERIPKRAKALNVPEGMSDDFMMLIDAEPEANLVRTLATAVLPARSQTDEYAAALMRAGGASEDAIERGVELRGQRRAQVTGPRPLHMEMLVTETVVRRIVGSPTVMAAALDFVVDLDSLPNASVRVIKDEAGPFPGMMSTVSIYDFHYPPNSRAVFLEDDAGSRFLENEADVQRCSVWYGNGLRLALSPRDSIRLIKNRAKELRR